MLPDRETGQLSQLVEGSEENPVLCQLVLACKMERREQEAGRKHQGIPGNPCPRHMSSTRQPQCSLTDMRAATVFLAASLLVLCLDLFRSQVPTGPPSLQSLLLGAEARIGLCWGQSHR